MSRKSKFVDIDHSQRWIFSYADFITLLFAFFVVMYAVSSVNLGKYKQLSEALDGAFKTKVEIDTSSTVKQKEQVDSNAQKQYKQKLEAQGKFLQTTNLLKDLKDEYDDMRTYEDWVEIELSSKSLFQSGQADPTDSAIIKLKKLADKLKQSKSRISIEGYTDNEPIYTARYPSNWELSAARAAAVARVLTDSGVNPNQVSVVGFGEQYPVADNKTEKGRQKNRRVVLVIARDGAVQRLLNPPKSDVAPPTIAPTTNVKPTVTPKKIEDEPIKTPVLKEIRTKSGGLKFTREFLENKEKPKTQPQPQPKPAITTQPTNANQQ